jgi:phage gp36-like protein
VSYLDLAEYKKYSILPSVDIDDVETIQAGWIDRKLRAASNHVDARLRKRYSVPFSAPFPDAVCDWVARLVDPLVLKKRGVDATDEQFISIVEDAVAAREDIKEAANAEDGLFDLPVADTADASAISKGAPLGYSEASPYVGMDVQEDAGRDEDSDGWGSGDG